MYLNVFIPSTYKAVIVLVKFFLLFVLIFIWAPGLLYNALPVLVFVNTMTYIISSSCHLQWQRNADHLNENSCFSDLAK